MISDYILVIIVAIIGLGISGWCACEIYGGRRIPAVIGLIVTIIVTVAICGGILWRLHNTQSGARAIKDTKSNVFSGIERTVTVYDFDGDIIQQYSGKFDVDYDSERIKFDDENGKRHVIYCTTGTVIVDEN